MGDKQSVLGRTEAGCFCMSPIVGRSTATLHPSNKI